jgi:2-hydroxychromene-2-carboxylate isomerase
VTKKTLGYWFDYSCPYAYVGSLGVEALAERAGAELVWEPFLLGGVFRAIGTDQKLFATLGPAKAKHNAEDMLRWADAAGVKLSMPADHPFRTVEALRATLLTKNDPKVIHGFYEAYWVHNRPISDEATMRDVLTAAGHDPDSILPRLSEAKDDLIARTDRAIALGIFGAPAYQVGDRFYWGQDRAHFAEAALTGETAPLPGTPKPDAVASKEHTLEVFWDFSSPFSYLGVTQVEALAKRTGCKVIWKPMLLGGLFRAIGMADLPLSTWPAPKQRYYARDMTDWSSFWNVPFAFPSRFPTNSLKAMRLYLALPEEARSEFRSAAYEAYWAHDRDLTDDAVLADLLGEHYEAAVAGAATGEVKNVLKENTEEAAKRGVFGAPTFIVDGEQLYWGQDRIGLVEAALSK